MTVEQYLEELPAEKQTIMYKVRNAIVAAAPKAEEVFAYNMPGYLYMGPLLYFCAYKNHYSLFGVGKNLLRELKDELAPFKINGSTIQFTDETPLPLTLLKKIVKMRLKENEMKNSDSKSKNRKTKVNG